MDDNTPKAVGAGRAFLIEAYLMLLGSEVATKLVWFSQFGFKWTKLGSVLVTCLLFYYAYQGSAVARWLTVSFGVLAIALGMYWELYQFLLGLSILFASTASVILLCLPQVGTYQDQVRRSRDPGATGSDNL